MNIWNVSKLTKWLNRARKSRLNIDFENGYILDGYSIFKIGDELKKILNTHYLITGSVSIVDGEIKNDATDLKRIFNNFCSKLEESKRMLELTPYCRITNNATNNIFYSEELMLEVNKNFIEVINQTYKVKYYGTKTHEPLVIEVDGEVIGFILPSRNTSPYEIKKATHTK